MILVPIFLAHAVAFAAPALETVEERYADGTIKARYELDDQGRRHGDYREFHLNGEEKLRARYAKGLLDGPYATFYPDGSKGVNARYRSGKLDGPYLARDADGEVVERAEYEEGALDGERTVTAADGLTSRQTWKAGTLVRQDGFTPFPRSLEELEEGLRAINSAPWDLAGLDLEEDPALTRERELGLRRLKAYRFLCGLRYADLELDPTFNEHCQWAAKLCHAIGRIDHTPENPGWPDDEYNLGYSGTSHSNLAMSSVGGVARSVDSYMDDSDPSNIDRVGHRRHCLAPALKRTGFGKYGGYSAMWSMDRSGKAEAPDVVAYPPAGHVPLRYLGERHAWSVTLTSGAQIGSTKDVRVVVHELGPLYGPVGEALRLDHLGAVGDTLVFRPVLPRFEADAAYRVEITGIPGHGKGEPLRYLVALADL